MAIWAQTLSRGLRFSAGSTLATMTERLVAQSGGGREMAPGARETGRLALSMSAG
jgi:hypothetical protein